MTFVEILLASSIQLYLTFKTLKKNLYCAIFFKILNGPFSFYLDFYTTEFCTRSEEYCILFKKLQKNIGHRVNFRDIFKKLTFDTYTCFRRVLVTMATNMMSY